MRGRAGRLWGVWGGLVGSVLLAGCGHVGHVVRGAGDCPPGGDCHDHAKVCHDPSLMALGHDLDHLERHIDWYGSVVARGPDVWGQARLTEHREQFEEEMEAELKNFHLGLQGSLARSDQAFFAHATALSSAAQPKPPAIGRVSSVKSPPVLVPTGQQVVADNGRTVATADKDKAGLTLASKQTTTTTFEPAPNDPPIKAAANPDLTQELTDLKEAIHRTDVHLERIGFGAMKDAGIGIEPTLMLAQKKRFLDFLNQVRRENEGDDTADSPGYSLNLVRIPVSILPGKRTDVGHGAEITMTLTPVLGDDLLPTTFRNLVANDLRHQLGLPLAEFLNDKDAVKQFLKAENRPVIMGLPVFNELNVKVRSGDQPAVLAFLRGRTSEERGWLRAVAELLDAGLKDRLLALLAEADVDATAPTPRAAPGQAPAAYSAQFHTRVEDYAALVRARPGDLLHGSSGALEIRAFSVKLNIPSLAFSPGLVNKTGFPTSQLLEVYGLSNCFQIAFAANNALADVITRQGYAHLPDVQGFLQQETVAAYRFLADPQCAPLWQAFCTPEVASAVRTRKLDQLEEYREHYRALVRQITTGTAGGRADRPYLTPGEYTTTAALAWCILVDSALLTDKLVQDMGETASAKRATIPSCGAWLDYYHPHPSPEARVAFAEYVKLRWPVRVFALDPSTQDQNIADALSTRRETQLALAIAFTNGFINANTMTRYARRLEAEYETIALNRTQVGFGHGDNVFGWRFYPRFQTPDTEGNLTVLLRDQLIGGPNRNQLLRDRRLEPGPRECVALVMMPSFVPYVTMDTVGNWFGLANPKHKVLDHTQALRLSRTVQTLKRCGPGVTDAACYRDGEFERMLRRVEQLEARLPGQTVRFPVPVLNTLGGFEMFSNGTTDLAPELYGWYGAPGVSARTTTTLFLVGDHFSPLHTKVIVGNKPAGNPKMLSRQVIQVEVPADAVQLGGTHVTAHLATPYGVTRELLIPVVGATPPAAPAPTEGFALKADAVTVGYCKAGVTGAEGKFLLGVTAPPAGAKVVITWDDALGVAPKMAQVRLRFEYNKCPFEVVIPDPLTEKDGAYTVDGAALKLVTERVATTLNQFGPFTDATNPFAGELPGTVIVSPIDPGRASRDVTLTTPLRFTFRCEICPPVAPAPAVLPAAPDAGLPTPLPRPTPEPVPAVPQPAAPVPRPIPLPQLEPATR